MNSIAQMVHENRMKLLEFAYADTHGESVESIKATIQSFYSIYSCVVANLGSQSVYRVRKVENGSQHLMQSDLWHPPVDRITKIGRANNIGVPVLYCAFDPKTAIDEANIHTGDLFSLGIFALAPRDEFNMTSVVIREAGNVSGQDDDLSIFGVELSRFMVNEFTRPVPSGNEGLYKRSCAIAEILLDLPHKDSIIYPSVKNHDSINIAISSEAAKERVKLVKVVTCKLLPDRSVEVHALYLPGNEDCLVAQQPKFPLPCPLKLNSNTINFSSSFDKRNISTPEEIIAKLVANKSMQRDAASRRS